MNKKFIRAVAVSGICLLSLVFLAGASWAEEGDRLPYVDTGFNSVSPDDDPTLIIVRELFDESTHEQAIYFRVFDDTRYEGDAVSGVILFPTGVAIKEIISSRELIQTSDVFWGLEGADYTGRARGLEKRVPDYVRWVDNRIEFYLTIKGGVDEFRVIIDYGDLIPGEAYFDIALSEGSNNEGIPYLNRIEVGNIDGDVPGSGAFDRVSSLRIPLIESDREPETCEVPLPVALDIKPESLNLNKKAFKAVIRIAGDYLVENIDKESLACMGATPIKVNQKGDKLIVKFPTNRLDVVVGDSVGMTVTGSFSDGKRFEGYDIVKISDGKKKKKLKGPDKKKGKTGKRKQK